MTRRFFVEYEQKTGSSNQNFSVTPDQRSLSGTLSDITQTKGFAGSDLPSDEKQGRLNRYELKTATIESISRQWLYATHLLVGYERILTSKNTPLSSASYSWLPVEVLIAVAWFLKSYWNNNSSSFNPITQKELRQDHPLAAIITMPGSGNDQPQHPPSASSAQQAQETTVGPTGSFNNFLNSDSASAGGNGGSQQHLHTLGLDCFVSPCHGVCQFRPSSDSSRPAVPMDTDIPLESDPCPICLVHFHGRDEVLVVVKSQCCGHYFDLDCISKCFVNQPIGSRRCAMCRQDPMPMVNENTGESYPDRFFPDLVFYRACFQGDLDQVEKSLVEGVNVNAVMHNGLTALILVSYRGGTDVAERLINAGANVNAARTRDGCTPLFMAAQENNTNCLKTLIKAKADLNARVKDGRTALFIAARMGNTACVKLLINAEADLNAAMPDATPLFIAAQKGNTDCLKALIEGSANINARTVIGATALMVAAQMGNTDCVERLIEAEADIDAALLSGATPLFVAAKNNNIGCVKRLINAGANLDARRTEDGFTPLHIAILLCNTECVEGLINAGAAVNIRTTSGSTPLHIAVRKGYQGCVQRLINAGADINAQRTEDGATPLLLAAREGHTECLKHLIRASANINTALFDGTTPLSIATEMGKADCVRILTHFGAR